MKKLRQSFWVVNGFFCCYLIFTYSAIAQIPPLPTPEELLPSDIPKPTRQIEESDNLIVQRFQFVGNTVFSSEKLAEVTKSFTKRPISFADLIAARTLVTQLYVNSGYITSGAYIPAQKIENGVVRIAIIEGSVEVIKIRGTGKLDPDYVRSRLQKATKAPLHVPSLLEALQILQLNPLIEKISAELSAGVNPGESLLSIQIQEAKTFAVLTSLNNSRSPSVGSFRRAVELSEANLLGFGDSFNFTYDNTDGSDVFDVAYTLPLNSDNSTLRFTYSTRSSRVIEPPFDDLDEDGEGSDIKSESRTYELSFRQPIIQTPKEELALGIAAERQERETSILNVPFPLQEGADDWGRTRTFSLRFFQEWIRRTEADVLAARSQFSFGIGVFDATLEEKPPDGRYFAWRGQAQWVKLLAPETFSIARIDLQLADRALIPQEQFSNGGIDTVRGYRQDALLTDNGIFASFELRLPVFREPKQQMLLQVTPFLEFGTGWNNFADINLSRNTLASVGLGLRYEIGDRFTARLDWGIPLISIDSEKRTLQEKGLYFSVIYSLF